MHRSISHKIIRNTIFNTTGRFIGIVVAFFMTPYIVSHLGVERFGIWAIVGVLTGYIGLLDFGIGTSFVKYIAEFYAKKDYAKINELINTGFVLYSLFFVFISIFGFTMIDQLLGIFSIPQVLKRETAFVFVLAIVLFGTSNVVSVFAAVQGGLQKMDVSNKVTIAMLVPNIAGTFYVLENGYGLPGLMLNNAVILVLSGVIAIIIAFRLLPELRFDPFMFNKQMVKRLISFGYKVQITRVSGLAAGQTDKMLIGLFLPISLVTFYQLGNTIVMSAMSVSALLVSALIPAFSEIDAKGERDTLIKAYLRGTKYLTFVVVPLFIFIIFSAPYIILCWMGKGYDESNLIIQVLAAGWMINTIAQVAASTCIAIDKPQIMATGSIIIITLSLCLNIVFIKTFGFRGVGWGTSFAVAAGTLYFIYMLHDVLKISLQRFIGATLPYIVIGLLAGTVIFGIDYVLGRFYSLGSRGGAALVLMMRGLIFMSVYLAVINHKKIFDAVDINFFHERLPLMKVFIK